MLQYDDTHTHTHPPLNGSGGCAVQNVVTGNGSAEQRQTEDTSAMRLISTINAETLNVFGDHSGAGSELDPNTSGHIHHVHYADSVQSGPHGSQQQHLHLINANNLSDSSTALIMATGNPAAAAMLGQYYPLQGYNSASGSGTTTTSTTGPESSGLFLLDSNATLNQSGTLQRNSRIRFSLAERRQSGSSPEDHRVKI